MMYNLIPLLIIFSSLFIIVFLTLRRIPKAKEDFGKVSFKEPSQNNKEEDFLKPAVGKIQLKKSFFGSLKKRILKIRAREEKEKKWSRSLEPPPKPKTFLKKIRAGEAAFKEKTPNNIEPKRRMIHIGRVVVPIKKGMSLGSKFFRKKSFTQKENELLDKLDTRPGDYQVLKELSQFYMKEKKYEKALGTLKRLIEVRPTDFSSYGDYGFISMKLSNYSDAVEAYKIAVDHDPQNIEYLENLTLISEKLDNMPMLKSTLIKLLDVDPNNKRVRTRLKELEKQSKLL